MAWGLAQECRLNGREGMTGNWLVGLLAPSWHALNEWARKTHFDTREQIVPR